MDHLPKSSFFSQQNDDTTPWVIGTLGSPNYPKILRILELQGELLT